MSAPGRNAFDDFIERYGNDPVLFVREVFGVEPDPWQCELMMAVAKRERRISVRSGHGVGKSTALAWLIVWHILTKFPQKTVATAPTSAQLFDALAAETKGWILKLPPMLQERLHVTTDRIVLVAAPDESFVSFATSRAETPEALAGKHSENVLLVADEASGIPQQVFEAASGSMSGHNAVTVLAGNPVRSSGLFYDSHHKAKAMWHTIVVSCADCARVAPDFIEQMKIQYGERSNAFRVRVLGEFPVADDDTIIPKHLVDSALERDVKPHLVKPIWGLDCAGPGLGSDNSALAKRKGNVLMEKVKTWGGLETMQLVGRVKHEWDMTPVPDRPNDICVDSIGLGAGVADRLREIGLPARSINVSETMPMKGGNNCANLKSELWFIDVRGWFASLECSIANDTVLAEQLVSLRVDYTSAGKTLVESKKALKKRGVPSPDEADAFVLTFAVDAVAATHGSTLRTGWGIPLPKRGIGIV